LKIRNGWSVIPLYWRGAAERQLVGPPCHRHFVIAKLIACLLLSARIAKALHSSQPISPTHSRNLRLALSVIRSSSLQTPCPLLSSRRSALASRRTARPSARIAVALLSMPSRMIGLSRASSRALPKAPASRRSDTDYRSERGKVRYGILLSEHRSAKP
jgi:hypothetical protein